MPQRRARSAVLPVDMATVDRCLVFKILTITFLNVLITSCYAAPLFEDVEVNEDDVSVDGEFGEYFEGDMLLRPQQRQAISMAEMNRNGLVDGVKRWPDRTVIYLIEEDDFDEEQVLMIESAMKDIANKSCIKFRPKENNEHAVLIKGTSNGCFSNVGFTNVSEDEEEVQQVLNLAKGCFKHGTVVHEMLHTLGFYHMQSTYNRDEFVQIIWENIKSGTEHNFAKYNNDTVTDFGVEYDYGSVMHYPENAFSKNGNKTIIPLQEGAKIGQRKGMSESDIIKLNKMYCEPEKETTTEKTE
ncbi:seminal metalloprotease 1 [Papilio machaon]|uniref:seminal metalloprotease 1 n=1 Tax=Papilio machaon TaxID=76193 RepID=UPI001E6651B1|nr:seminal metalloprotease 1 [Papilio machaon]